MGRCRLRTAETPVRIRLTPLEAHRGPSPGAKGFPRGTAGAARAIPGRRSFGHFKERHTSISTLKGKVADVKLWTPVGEVESSALDQLRRIAALPWVFHRVAAMPDVCPRSSMEPEHPVTNRRAGGSSPSEDAHWPRSPTDESARFRSVRLPVRARARPLSPSPNGEGAGFLHPRSRFESWWGHSAGGWNIARAGLMSQQAAELDSWRRKPTCAPGGSRPRSHEAEEVGSTPSRTTSAGQLTWR